MPFILAAVVAISVISAVQLARFGSKLRRLVVDGLSVSEFRRVDLQEFLKVNRESLLENTTDLEALGFTCIADFTVVRSKPSPGSVVSRLMFNGESKCKATLTQHFDARGAFSITVIILSSSLESGWTIGTHDAPLNPWSSLMRHPRVIGRRMTGMGFSEMLSAHQKLVGQISNDLKLRIVTLGGYEEHVRELAAQTVERRELVARNTALNTALTYFWQKLCPNDEWLGDYPKEKKRLRASPSV